MRKCLLCNKRTSKRFCPYYQKNICSICCGEKRKEINCPKDCVYLKNAQTHLKEKLSLPLLNYEEDFNKNLRKELIHLKNTRLKDLKEEEILEVLEIIIEKVRLETKNLIYEPKIIDIRKQLIYETIENLIKNHSDGKKEYKKYDKETILTLLKLEEKIIKELKNKEEDYFKIFSLLS
ncbi:MAG: hypothetical protein N2323_06755 [candidate division WOR-3 bacterium]|nr:hypothetical protein [candidate division WOR-3 bacterium]MCX7837624.1 hypothetical protein [candidate division WOR-3 bacterium]MDW8114431.1 hypothetical protein [candidate division WOR-3 bacterium]